MTWPIVTVNQVNQLLGETKEVERTLLFIGTGTKNVEKLWLLMHRVTLTRYWVRETVR